MSSRRRVAVPTSHAALKPAIETVFKLTIMPAIVLVIVLAVGALGGCAAGDDARDVLHTGGKLLYDTLKAAKGSEHRDY